MTPSNKKNESQHRRRGVRLWLGLIVFASGCTNFGLPAWSAPGSTAVQRSRAATFDPYASRDAGPSVEDTRPRDYSQPVNETRQSRRFIESLSPSVGF